MISGPRGQGVRRGSYDDNSNINIKKTKYNNNNPPAVLLSVLNWVDAFMVERLLSQEMYTRFTKGQTARATA